ncbi:arylsulfatase A-like enzyme [Flavobacterium sp. W4I14]|nr:arylsulfatase A-like enzyme [Flavobacterium sp. W4I14]
MLKSNYIQRIMLIGICMMAILCASAQQRKPNIIIIYADDLGYGDLSCYGADKINTPNIDALAEKGLRFTNAHASSSTCTPSRFSMLTGKYAWRQKGTGIADGDAPLIIPKEILTLPAMLKNAGYRTAVVGKWHLGLGGKSGPDWNSELKPGPLEIGFDYSFIIPATADRVPCVFVENHRVVGWHVQDPIEVNYHHKIGNDPTGYENPEKVKIKADDQHNKTIIDSISRIGYMSGGKKARWLDGDIAQTLENKAMNFIDLNSNRPFFLYLATHDIHVPRSPNSRFLGKSKMGLRGDAILQLDWIVGELIAHLKAKGLFENTMIIFSSDNGPVLADGYQDEAVLKSVGHHPAGQFRGGKYSPFEGGTRIPFIVHWQGHVRPDSSSLLISQVDLFASLAKLTGQKLGKGDAQDSYNLLGTLLGNARLQRKDLVEHAMNNSLSLIYKNWKYVEDGKELYDLSTDPSESKNLATAQPEMQLKMVARLEKIKKSNQHKHSPIKQ